ncbi:hypothetical protein [Chryseobacterium fistulae]|uniref:Tetratricopeptide repeat protein n=1 Tax=Chryseobacterium fistulae TaxID=2675058 RepID=A0A6N4XTJ2_9FLAO|nr:hypothetical protein [Chryseobacterium fistulae]CAA7386949.1 hypothetical protein CHRY9393_01250 [Chryseobacterium fistulae]
MKKLFTQLPLVCISIIINAQSNFNKGFNMGYGEGYCHDKGVGCIKPLSPMAPMPTIGESINSYQDGYNRGFQQGLNAQKSNATSQRYQTSKPKFIEDKMYNPYGNVDNVVKLALALKESKGRALELLESEEYQAVADICFAGLRVSPKDDEFMLILASAYKSAGDKQNALKWFKIVSYYRRGDENLKEVISTLENEVSNEE